jgi:hypothetical protein
MGELTSSLATLAARLGGRPGIARLQGGVADGASLPGVGGLTGILAIPLDEFAANGELLEVRVPWLDVTLWFVPEERDAEALVRDGVNRGRVWTATELMAVMAIGGRTSEALRPIALAKLTFDGDIAAVRSEG